MGLSHTKCTRDIYVPSKGNTNTINYGNCSLTKPDVYSECKTIQLVTLDSCNIKEPVFIKIDVEGFEQEVLKGLKNTLIEFKPTIIFEHSLYRLNERGHRKDSVTNYLESLGYKIYKQNSAIKIKESDLDNDADFIARII